MKLRTVILVAISTLCAHVAHAQERVFDGVLAQCLSERNASVFTCADMAAKAARVNRIKVTRETVPAGTGTATENHVESCSSDGYEICHHYNCSEDNGQSICDFVGTTCGEYWC